VRLSPRCPERPREGGLAAGVGAGGWIYAVENWTVGDNFGSSSTAVSRVSRLARTTNERHPRAPTSERVGLWVLPGCGEHTGTARALGGSWLGCNEDMERGGPGGGREEESAEWTRGWRERATRGAGDHKTTAPSTGKSKSKSKSRFARLWRQQGGLWSQRVNRLIVCQHPLATRASLCGDPGF
jgi:hypothetical protein